MFRISNRASHRRALIMAASVVVVGAEAGVGWLALHPNVNEAYRAYYIDQTTTCLDKGQSGRYVLGRSISFLPDDTRNAFPIRVCGWSDAAANGSPSVGTSSILRFAVDGASHGLILRLQMMGMDGVNRRPQRVVLTASGVPLGEAHLQPGVVQTLDFPVPDQAIAEGRGRLDIRFAYPDAAAVLANDSETHWRAIRLLAVQLRGPGDAAMSGPQDDPDAHTANKSTE